MLTSGVHLSSILDLPVLHLAGLLVIGFTLFSFLTVIYRLTLHPLARYPGPLLAKITDWHNWYHAKKGDRHIELHRQHEKYGPIVRFRPDSLSINSPTAIQALYASKKPYIAKSDWYRFIEVSAGGHSSTFTAINDARHAHKRRLLAHAFSDSALRDMSPRIDAQVMLWLDQMKKVSSQNPNFEIDIGKYTSYLIFDVLADLCFGKSFEAITSEKNRFLLSGIPAALDVWYSLGYHPLTQFLRVLLFKTPFGKYVGGADFDTNDRFRKACSEALKQRRQAESTLKESDNYDKDFFYYLLNAKDPETGTSYAKGELEAESVLLIVAGSDSAAATLSSTFFYLTRNPDCLARLTKEIRSAFPTLEDITYPNAKCTLATLEYLRACINETLRMTPPTPGHVPREILKEGLVIDDIAIPANTVIGISIYAMHHDERFFPDSFRYHPERWLSDSKGVTPESLSLANSAFCAFSTGPRGCIGKNMAYMEVSLALAKVLWSFDLKRKPGDETGAGGPGKGEGRHRTGEFQIHDSWIVSHSGPVVQLVPRGDL